MCEQIVVDDATAEKIDQLKEQMFGQGAEQMKRSTFIHLLSEELLE